MSENQLLEERIAAVMVRPVTLAHLVKPLLVDVLATIGQLRAERDAYIALYAKEKEWRSEAEVALADMTAAELEAERKRHT